MLTASMFANFLAFRHEFMPDADPLAERPVDIQPIDAPEVIAAGSVAYHQFSMMEGGYVGQSLILREQS